MTSQDAGRFKSESGRNRLIDVGFVAGLLLLTVIVYLPAIRGGFIWDDEHYIYGNAPLRSLTGLYDIWFVKNAIPQYYPLVHTTFWLEYRLWGLNPTGYHVVNVLLHAAAAVFLRSLLQRMGVPGGTLAAFVFALHPVHVESVAWITERKNVLSAVFYLLAFRSYWQLVLQQQASPKPARYLASSVCWYALACGFFLAALWSKTVTCSLPAAILLAIWWKTGRLRSLDVLPVLPLFLIGLSFGLMTARIEREFVGAEGTAFNWSTAERCLIAGRAVWFYFGKLLWPSPLIFFYPKWTLDVTSVAQWLYPLSAVVFVSALWSLRNFIGRGPLVVALFYGGTLLPSLGFFNVYPMRYSFVADHFQYHASLGPIALFAAAVTQGCLRRSRASTALLDSRWLATAAASPVVLTLGLLTWQHAHKFADLEGLYRSVLADNWSCAIAHNNLGLILRSRGELKEALLHFREGVKFSETDDVQEQSNVAQTSGELLLEQGDVPAAIVQFDAALQLWPDFHRSHFYLAEAYARLGKIDLAAEHSMLAIQKGRQFPSAYRQLARLLFLKRDYVNAAAAYRIVLKAEADPEAAAELAWILATHWDSRIRNESEAQKLAEFAFQRTNYQAPLPFDALAAASASMGDFESAAKAAENACEIVRRSGDAAYLQELEERLGLYRAGQVYRLDPNDQ